MADKRYIVTLTQTGTAAPLVTSIRNTFEDDFVYTYDSSGVYIGTLADALNPTSLATIDITPLTDVISVEIVDVNSFKITMSGDDTLSAHRLEVNQYDATTTTTAAANAIITVDDVKDFLNTTDATDDEYIQSIINDVSSAIEGINGINNKVKVQDIVNEIGSGNGRYKYRPEYYPIYALGISTATTDAAKLASLQYRDDVDSAWTNIEDTVAHILFNNPRLDKVNEQNSYTFELTEELFPVGVQNIRLNYQAGWSSIPGDLKLVCLEQVANIYKRQSFKKDGNFGLSTKNKSEGGGSWSVTFIDFTEKHKKIMKPYRRVL